jgi:hypothetical protein
VTCDIRRHPVGDACKKDSIKTLKDSAKPVEMVTPFHSMRDSLAKLTRSHGQLRQSEANDRNMLPRNFHAVLIH